MLRGSFNKTFKFQSIVTSDILRKVAHYLHSRSEIVKYEFETSDGAKYDTESIDNIIGYSNPSDAMIEKISLIAQKKEEDRYFAQNFIIVKFYDRESWDSSASLYIADASSDEIAAISKELGGIIKLAKANYSWIYSSKFLNSIGLILSMAISILLYSYVVPLIKESNPSWYIVYLLLQFAILGCLFRLFVKIREWAYPESVFNIGEQEASYKMIIKRRNYILGVISTIVLGVLSSICATKYF